eukprot:gene15220-21299_t
MVAPASLDSEDVSSDFDEGYDSGSDSQSSDADFSEVGPPSATEVVYVKEGIAVWPTRNERIMGRLSLVKQHNVTFMAWLPYSRGTLREDGTFVATPYSGKVTPNRSKYAVHPIPLSDVKALRRTTPSIGWHYIVVVLVNGVTLPPLYFHNGGVKAFLRVLKQHAHLMKSASDPLTYLVNDTADPLQRSLTSLELVDVLIGAPPPGASFTAFTPSTSIMQVAPHQCNSHPISSRASSSETSTSILDQAPDSGSDDPALADEPYTSWEQEWDGLGSRHQLGGVDPSWRTLSAAVGDSLSRLLQGHSAPWFMGTDVPPMGAIQEQDAVGHGTRPWYEQPECPPKNSLLCSPAMDGGHDGEGGNAAGAGAADAKDSDGDAAFEDALDGCAQAGSRSHSGRKASSSGCRSERHTEEDSLCGFEMVDAVRFVDDPANIRGRVQTPAMSEEEFESLFDDDGRLVGEEAFRARAFASGLSPKLRREGWKWLLGVYPRNSTAAERVALGQQRRKQYASLKRQWKSIIPSQAARFDKSQPFYAIEGGPHARSLRRILLTYTMYNFNLGYCQGMSDLAAPMLSVMRDEADAFWAFTALMDNRNMCCNFDCDQQGMHAQLLAVRKLMQVLDPQLHAHFEANDALNYYFCFRWLLVGFKREFKSDEVAHVWEALWACPLTPHMHIYLCAAVLIHHRRAIIEQNMCFDELLKFCCELGGKLELEPLLRLAETLATYAGQAGVECLSGLALPRCCDEGAAF